MIELKPRYKQLITLRQGTNSHADGSTYGATTPATETHGRCGVDASGSGQGIVVSCCGHSN